MVWGGGGGGSLENLLACKLKKKSLQICHHGIGSGCNVINYQAHT